MPRLPYAFAALLLAPLAALSHAAELATQVTRHGVTWTFDQPRPVGHFVTGDPWVVGPVTIVSVSPPPGPATDETDTVKSIYGHTAMRDDLRMRNGSMILLRPGRGQGYDSRLVCYDPALSLAYPLELSPGRALVSTISHTEPRATVLHADLMWAKEKTNALALRSAAILTCLSEPPPPDAFRPPYVGDAPDNPLRRLSELRWDRLPALPPPPGGHPSPARFARYLERPWLDHLSTWTFMHLGPSENQVNYGRDITRVTAIAGLLLMLDLPREEKEPVALGLVQLGLDLAGLADAGRVWNADGGHWIGRKFPILLAGHLLDDSRLTTLAGSGIFAEDQQSYHGAGWAGQTALYQIVLHTGAKPPHEHKSPSDWTPADKLAESYRISASASWPGVALATLLIRGKADWNHDAFFDYCDRWMSTDDPYAERRGPHPRPRQEGRTYDPFVDAMWRTYRDTASDQPGGRDHRRWTWDDDNRAARFHPNPAPLAP